MTSYQSMIIRDEQPGDIDAIFALTEAAFAPMPFSEGTEPHIINALRADGDLTLSLVAEVGGTIVGQITFSPVRLEELPDWYGLGPVSVAPNWQKGQKSVSIGSALINTGLSRLKALSANGCVLVGNPDYYSRFGFRSGGITYGDVPEAFVQWLSFGGDVPGGEVRYARGFGN